MTPDSASQLPLIDLKHLASVEKWTYGLAALAIALAFVLAGGWSAFSISLGAALMSLNAWALRRIGQRAFRAWRRPGAAVLLFNLKMALVLGIVFALVRYARVDGMAFMIGISVFPVAVVAVAIQHTLSGAADLPVPDDAQTPETMNG